MRNEINKVIAQMCEYYQNRGYNIERLAEAIGMSERNLQMLKNDDQTPRESTLNLFYEFLSKNDGGQFESRMKQLTLGYTAPQPAPKRGVFPKQMSEDDVKIIRDNFPTSKELMFMCAMVIYNNKAEAIKSVLPDGDIKQCAALISGCETKMEKAKKIYGINDFYEWKDKVIKYITQIPEKDGDIESLGQTVLDNIVNGYLSGKGITYEK